jgi:FMN-dependent NADH-azoreductase
MTNLLLLTSSPRGKASYSTQLALELSGRIEGARVTVRDLANNPLPHIGPEFVRPFSRRKPIEHPFSARPWRYPTS